MNLIEKKNRETIRSLYAEKNADRGSDERIRLGGEQGTESTTCTLSP